MTDVKNSEVKKTEISANTTPEKGEENTGTENPDTNNAVKEKQLCDGATCPAVQNRKILSLKEGLKDLDKILASLQGLCAASSCPFSKKSKISAKSNINNNDQASSKVTNHCGGQTCPVTVGEPVQKKDTLAFESAVTSNNKYASYLTTSNIYSNKFAYPSSPKPNGSLNGKEPCGGYTCPYTATNLQKPTTASYKFPTNINDDLCGQSSCPYSSQEYNPNQNIPKTDFANQVLNCGLPACPFNTKNQSNLLTGMATGIFPYGNQNNVESKKFHCGSPSCTNLNPSSMVYTHYYANDYGFVEESARPYCGSSCPYDYLSSINNQYPNVQASNYPTFECSKYSGSVPCPYVSKQNGFQMQKMNGAVEEGICGADKNHSCDHPDVEKCESPDCKVAQKKTNVNNFEFCEDCGGVKAEKINIQNSNPIIQNIDKNSVPTKTDEIQEKIINEKSLLQVTYKSDDTITEIKENNENIDNEGSISKVAMKKNKKDNAVLYTYPGVQIGHKECLIEKRLVPGNMGWLWNIMPDGNQELWRGYKPGAISRTVHKMMKAHKKYLNILDSSSDVIRKKKSKIKVLKPEDLKHCLEVKKKDGDIFVTVNPVRDPETVNPADNPFMEVTPMQFKIEKEKKEEEKEEAYCPCDETSVKTYNSSENSELEFLFSPPAALPPFKIKKKKHMQEIETQYDVNDLPVEFRTSTKNIKNKKRGSKKGKKGIKDAKGKVGAKGNKEVKGKKKK